MTTVPTYRDDLVMLTGYTVEDVEDHLAGEDEETARQFGWWPERSTPDTVRRAFTEWADNWRDGGPIHTFAMRHRITLALLGGCQLRRRPDGVAEVSYWTGVSHRGRGYARRALRLLCIHADDQAVGRLEADVAAGNRASQAVLSAVGFREIARFHDGQRRLIKFAMDLQ